MVKISTTPNKVTESQIILSDNTTNNVSDSAHGFVPKATNAGTTVLLDTGAYGSVANAHLSTTAGNIGGAWVAWTPTLSGQFTDGDWTKTCYYTRIGKTIIYRFFVKATDSTPMAGGSGHPTFTLPVEAASYPGSILTTTPLVLGPAMLVDAAPAFYQGHCRLASSTTANILVNNASGTYVQNTVVDATTPFTWTTNDEIHSQGFYEAA